MMIETTTKKYYFGRDYFKSPGCWMVVLAEEGSHMHSFDLHSQLRREVAVEDLKAQYNND